MGSVLRLPTTCTGSPIFAASVMTAPDDNPAKAIEPDGESFIKDITRELDPPYFNDRSMIRTFGGVHDFVLNM